MKNRRGRREQGRLIMGRNCLNEVVRKNPGRITEVYTSLREGGDDSLLSLIKENKIALKYCSKQKLFQMTGSESHQSFVARVQERGRCSLKEFLAASQNKERSVVLMLDSITDPQNLGAILRAAECFGVDGVIWSKNRGVDLTPTVAKVSVGASELVEIIKVSNLAETLSRMKKEGYQAVTAELSEDAKPLSSCEFHSHVVIVMGSEGKGVRELISKKADERVYLPMKGRIDSLNVSQATAVFLYAVCS